MNIFSCKEWFAREYNYHDGVSANKNMIYLSLDEKLTVNDIVNILLNTSGLSHPFYHPVNLYLHYTRDNSELKSSVLYHLGISEFKGNDRELLSLLYMIVASSMWSIKLAREVCSVSKQEAITSFMKHSDYEDKNEFWLYPISIIAYVTGIYPYIEVGSFSYFKETRIKNTPIFSNRIRKRISRLYKYKASEIVILAEYYCNNYDPISKRRKLSLVHPYNAILYNGFLSESGKRDKTEKHIIRWINDSSYRMGMLPSNTMLEVDYIWDSLSRGRYFMVLNKKEVSDDSIENSTDRELVEYLQYLDPELQIVFSTRTDLMKLVEDTLDRIKSNK